MCFRLGREMSEQKFKVGDVCNMKVVVESVDCDLVKVRVEGLHTLHLLDKDLTLVSRPKKKIKKYKYVIKEISTGSCRVSNKYYETAEEYEYACPAFRAIQRIDSEWIEVEEE